MTFDTVHIVRGYGARLFFSTVQLNPHRKKRLFHGLPRHILRCGAVRFLFRTVRCGAVRCGAVRCGAVLLEAKSYGAVRCG